MMVIVSYDVSKDDYGTRRLRRVAKACESYGQRVQFSVFECLIEPQQWTALKQQLLGLIDMKLDSLRFYFLGSNWKRRVENYGVKKSLDPEGPMII